MGKWLLNIEASMWAVIKDPKEAKNQQILMDILRNALGNVEGLYFREELTELVGLYSYDYSLLELIANLPTKKYIEDDKAKFLRTTPEIITNISDSNIKKETEYQIGTLFNEDNFRVIHILLPERVEGHKGTLDIIKDKKITKRKYLADASPDAIDNVISRIKPRLKQAKHHMFEHSIGKGKIASTFKAWDKNDDLYAKQLLNEAFIQYKGKEWPAKNLYVWDTKNSTYVRFMHSQNYEYHGYDCQEKDVPETYKM